jgi:hypothetical protein
MGTFTPQRMVDLDVLLILSLTIGDFPGLAKPLRVGFMPTIEEKPIN